MTENLEKGNGLRGLLRFISMLLFGATLFVDQTDRFNLFRLGFGILIALIFGWVFRRMLRLILRAFNGKLIELKGKIVIKYAVDYGMLYFVPFSVMAIIAVFYLRWPSSWAFMSTGTLAVGTAATVEINRFTEKSSLKNTIASSATAYVFSLMLTLGLPLLLKVPGLIQGLSEWAMSFIKSGGGM